MAANIARFPAGRIFRSAELIEALEKLELCDEYEASGEPVKVAIASPMRVFWEEELVRLGGVPKNVLRRDGAEAGDA